MLASAQRTGSEIVVGALERFDGERSSMGPLMARNHSDPRARVTVEDHPLLLADVFSVNKVFSRDFWLAQDLRFPVGIRYEDQPTLTRALLAASSIDVLTEVVYRWRIRADGSSITQGRAEVADLRDRVATKRDSTAVVEAAAGPAVRSVWFEQVLPVDMWEYFRAAVSADDAYWSLLVSAMEEFWPRAERGFETTTVPVQQRLMGVLVARDRRDDLRTLLRAIDERGVRVGPDGVVDLPFAGDPDLPPRAYTVD
jgi:CDP-glycerol glycerophosphotransferase